MPPSATPTPDQTPAIAYGLYDREPIRTPGGGLIMPDLPPEAHAKQAHKDRLNDSAAWAELVLQDWFKRIAVFGVSAQFDIDRFERATQALWRLTAVAKSVFAFDESNPGIPPASSSLGARTSTSASPSPVSSPDHDQENPSSLGPRTASSASLSNPDIAQENPSSLGTRTAPSADAPVSNPEPPSPTTPTLTDALSPRSELRPPDSENPRVKLRRPFDHAVNTPQSPSLPSLSVRAVPSCPTLSPEGIETFLSRANADLAEATRPTPPILDLPPTPDKSLTSLPSLSSNPQSPIPHSEFHIPHSSSSLESHSPIPHSEFHIPHSSNPSEKAQWAFETTIRNPQSSCPSCPADFRPG